MRGQQIETPHIEAAEIRLDQVRLLARNAPAILIANLLMLTVMLSGVGAWMWWARRDEAFWGVLDASIIRRITLSSALGGGLWGLFALIVFPPDSLPHQVLLALVVGSTAAASLVSLQSIPLASASYILLSLAPLIISFGRAGDPQHWFMTEMLA